MSKYTINVPDSKLEELKTKLSTATFPDELTDASWDYGAPLADIKVNQMPIAHTPNLPKPIR